MCFYTIEKFVFLLSNYIFKLISIKTKKSFQGMFQEIIIIEESCNQQTPHDTFSMKPFDCEEMFVL